MSPYFFLSYSRADRSPLVKRFFDDLSDTIRIESNLPRTQAVGFYEETQYGPGSDWSAGAKDALQQSAVMICLLSTAYMHSERAGKEWQIFEMRRRRTFEEAPGPMPESLAHVILPVMWNQWHGPFPGVVNELLAHPAHIHQRQALMTMFKSAGMSHREYAEFVKALAHQITDLTPPANTLLPLDPFPPMSEVPSAFQLWVGGGNGSDNCEERSKRYEVPCWHAELVKRPAVKEQVVTNSKTENTSSTDQQKQSEPPANKKKCPNYLVFAVSKESQVLSLIEELCFLTPYHVKSYEDDSKALDARVYFRELPDLFVVDLDNAPPGQQVIKELTEKWKILSTIVAVSGDFEKHELPQLFGATAILPSLSRSGELKHLIKQCAEIGRKRRKYKFGGGRDKKRKQRPVFLSYTKKDEGLAKLLSSNLGARKIEVWSMHDSQKLGKELDAEVRKGLDDAQIFIALISTDFLKSNWCLQELKDFYGKATSGPIDEQQRLIIPVFYNDPDTSGNDFIDREVKPLTSAYMTDKDYLNGFILLMERIQALVHKE